MKVYFSDKHVIVYQLIIAMAANGKTTTKLVNVNVGVLGHVDSGKTSLCKTLSTVSSTACFDKNPQSQERGITLDLGFSSFLLNTKSESQLVSYRHC